MQIGGPQITQLDKTSLNPRSLPPAVRVTRPGAPCGAVQFESWVSCDTGSTPEPVRICDVLSPEQAKKLDEVKCGAAGKSADIRNGHASAPRWQLLSSKS